MGFINQLITGGHHPVHDCTNLYPQWTCIREALGDGTMTVCLGDGFRMFVREQFGTNVTGVCTKMCPGGIYESALIKKYRGNKLLLL